jgi:hypothetical protein
MKEVIRARELNEQLPTWVDSTQPVEGSKRPTDEVLTTTTKDAYGSPKVLSHTAQRRIQEAQSAACANNYARTREFTTQFEPSAQRGASIWLDYHQ